MSDAERGLKGVLEARCGQKLIQRLLRRSDPRSDPADWVLRGQGKTASLNGAASTKRNLLFASDNATAIERATRFSLAI